MDEALFHGLRAAASSVETEEEWMQMFPSCSHSVTRFYIEKKPRCDKSSAVLLAFQGCLNAVHALSTHLSVFLDNKLYQ